MSEHSFVERSRSLAFDSTQTLRAISSSVRAENRTTVKNAVNTTATISAVTTADSRPAPQSSATFLERTAQPQKSGRHRVAKQTASWISRLLGGSKN